MDTFQKPSSVRVIGGLVLILVGSLFLLGNLLGMSVLSITGPLFILAFGAMFFVGMFLGGKNVGGLAIPGSMFVILGLLLLAQSLFVNLSSWSYTWALIAPAGVGVGLVVFSWWSDKPNLKRPGYTLIVIGLGIFLVFGIFFEAMFGFSGYGMSTSVMLALALIGLGVLVLIGRFVSWSEIIHRLPPHNELKA